MKNYFSSKYPILLAPMNGCSTVSLASAAHESGIFPSLVPIGLGFYDHENLPKLKDSYYQIPEMLKEYFKLTNSKNVVLQLGIHHIKNNDILKFLLEWKPSHMFFMKPNPFYTSEEEKNLNSINCTEINDNLNKLLKNTKIFTNIKLNICKKIKPYDAYMVIGNNKAGLNGNLNLEEFVIKQKNLEPDFPIIASGGIYSSDQIKKLLNLGANAVSIGTMFAACKESPLSIDAKNKIINSSHSEVVKFKETNQNVLLINEAKHPDPEKSKDANSSYSLYNGVYGNVSNGHIPIGPAVNYIKKIEPIKEIVKMLTENL